MPATSIPLRPLAAPALSLACTTVAAQAPSATDLARLDGFVLGLESAGRFSGVVRVAQDGKVVFEKAYGPRDENGGAPLRADDRLNLAPAGKMFTRVATCSRSPPAASAWTATSAGCCRTTPTAPSPTP